MDARHSETVCYRSKITYDRDQDLIFIDHFGEKGRLLSRVRMDCEDAYSYARLIEEVCDHALGVE